MAKTRKRKQTHWFTLALNVKNSVIPSILNQVIFSGLFAVFISVAYLWFKLPVNQPSFAAIIPSVVLGLLLVFRTNTAYERFWEGRKLWSILASQSLNVSRQIWAGAGELEPEERAKRASILRLIIAFTFASKLALRLEPVNGELEELMPSSQYYHLKTSSNPPLQIILWMGDYLRHQLDQKKIQAPEMIPMQMSINLLVDSLEGCQRIAHTPIPLAYAVHLKQLLLLFCLLLPFQLVGQMGWLTIPIVTLVSFTLFGIEEIGIEIENPFGYDANDLPLDEICTTLKRDIEFILTSS